MILSSQILLHLRQQETLYTDSHWTEFLMFPLWSEDTERITETTGGDKSHFYTKKLKMFLHFTAQVLVNINKLLVEISSILDIFFYWIAFCKMLLILDVNQI